MHELRIAEDLASIVFDVAHQNGLQKVTRVNVLFGEMIQIIPDTFRFAFEEAVKGSVAEEAEVLIEIIPVKLKCNNCHSEFGVTNHSFSCKNCESIDSEIINGNELQIKSLEGE